MIQAISIIQDMSRKSGTLYTLNIPEIGSDPKHSNLLIFQLTLLGDCVARSLLLYPLGWHRSSPVPAAPCFASSSCRTTFWYSKLVAVCVCACVCIHITMLRSIWSTPSKCTMQSPMLCYSKQHKFNFGYYFHLFHFVQ